MAFEGAFVRKSKIRMDSIKCVDFGVARSNPFKYSSIYFQLRYFTNHFFLIFVARIFCEIKIRANMKLLIGLAGFTMGSDLYKETFSSCCPNTVLITKSLN